MSFVYRLVFHCVSRHYFAGPKETTMKTLKKITLTILLLACSTIGYSQVGVNTTTPNAQLDVRSSNQAAPSNTDGMLIPKIDTFPAVSPTAAQQGMLVYLTTTSGLKSPGFYYWDNTTTSWIGVGGKAGWELNGNTGTSPVTEFVGTTDNQGLAIRTNNTERMRIDETGFAGIGTSTPKNKLHVVGTPTGMTPISYSMATLESEPSSYLSILSTLETGVIFGGNGNAVNGGIIYNSPSLPEGFQFRAAGNQNKMILASNGNLGLGNFVPNFPLQFQNTVGDKISLWGTAGNHYGFGIQNSLMQIHSNTSAGDIAFGYGTSAAFTENMRMKGTGNVGIGTANPLSKLHVWKGNSGMTPNPSAGVTLEGTGFTYMNVLSDSETGVLFGSGGFHTNGGIVYNSGIYTNGMNFRTGGNLNRMNISSAGNVSIGDVLADARLHIVASNQATPANNDGIIIPRVNAFPAINPTAAQNGMMVFLTTASVGKLPGFYYWENASTSWKGVGTGANWSVTGNANTDSSMNFIGTTDNNDLVFKRNNVKAGHIGLSNTAFGAEASKANTSGMDNVAIGASALKVNTAGSYNVAVGTNALLSNTASEIVGIGENALSANTTGQFNTAVGTNAARTTATATCVTSMGYNSLFYNTASFNTAYGVNALSNNTLGEWNAGFGVDALKANTIGHHNTAFGDAAMLDNINGEQNTAVGHRAMANNESGGYNVAVGMNSLHTNQTGISNTALGTGALYWHGSGNNNTALGMEAMNNQTAGSNNIAIGKGANVPSLTGSNQLSIGNVIYGTGMNVATSAKIGVGTATPLSKMHVYSGASGMTPNVNAIMSLEGSGDTYLNVFSGGETGVLFGSNGVSTSGGIVYNLPTYQDGMVFRTNGNVTRMSISSAGNVGIGNYVPNFPLDFAPVLGDKICLWGVGTNEHYGFGIQNNLLQIHSDISASDIAFGYGKSSAFTEAMRIKGNGRVGIGTNAPDARVEIEASNTATPANTDGILIPRVSAFPVANPTAVQNGMMVFLTNTVGTYAAGFYYWDNTAVSWIPVGGKTGWSATGNLGTSPSSNFIGTNDNAALAVRTNGTERVRVLATGEVGIGTPAPSAELEVNGYTKLGSNAPAIKVVKLTGTTSSSQGTSILIPHGVTSSKILQVSAMVEYVSGSYVPAMYTVNGGYEFQTYINGSNIVVINMTANSANILSKPIKIMVTYEE